MEHISQIIDTLTAQDEDMHDAMHDEFYQLNSNEPIDANTPSAHQPTHQPTNQPTK